ncbi:MAG: hypothetical protein H6Q69_560 [Firmicutes bacterium]|nr:hypothetical protein [Bacillota bacterium]
MEDEMQQEENELHYLKHFSNLQRLSVEQLHAIKEEQSDVVHELATQKQIVMDSIVTLQGTYSIEECQLGFREKLKKILQEISSIDSESQQILQERCTALSKKMLANRKELSIQQSYEARPFQQQAAFVNIIK